MAGDVAPKFSLSFSSKPTASAKPSQTAFSKTNSNGHSKGAGATNKKRPHALLADDEEHDESDHTHEHISSFDAFADANRKAPERVIEALPGRDWKTKRQKSSLPAAQHNSNGVPAKEELKGSDLAYGMTIIEQSKAGKGDVEMATDENANTKQAPIERSVEQQAIDALTGAAPVDNHRIIRQDEAEDESFRDSVQGAPRSATLDEYEATPIEGFGAAILRGYLKPGETLQNRIDRVDAMRGSQKARNAAKQDAQAPAQPRPALLGIGAKAVEGAEMAELGIWGKARGKKGAMPLEYNPLAMKDRKTGEIISNEEYSKLTAAASKSEDQAASRGKEKRKPITNGTGEDRRNGHDVDLDSEHKRERERRRKRHEKDRYRDRDDYSSSRWRRSDSPDDKSHRRRHRDDDRRHDSEDEYYARKEKERRRRDRERDDYHNSSSSRRDRDRRDDRKDDRRRRDNSRDRRR